jgi:dTDP-glucose 4,6-dehydratase
VVHAILDRLGKPSSLIRHVEDRPGHDRRYAIDATRITNELGWSPRRDWRQTLYDTIDWYVANPGWWQTIRLRDPRFQEFYDRQYGHRLAGAAS